MAVSKDYLSNSENIY